MHPSLHFLNRRSVIINGVRVVGCTLWSHVHTDEYVRQKIEQNVNDYAVIWV